MKNTSTESRSWPSASRPATSFEVHVTKEDFKFHAAHFVAFQGYRERLHGHNYKCGVRLYGSRTIAHDGYVVDFGDVKKAVRVVCKQLNEHFICPTLSDVMDIVVTANTTETSNEGDDNAATNVHNSNSNNKHDDKAASPSTENVTLTCQDGSVFQFPMDDCAMLPIVHATAEELAIYLWSRILAGLDAQKLLRRGVHTMEIIVAEAVGQEAVFRLEIPDDPSFVALDVASFIQKGEISPAPCPTYDDEVATSKDKINNTSSSSEQRPPPPPSSASMDNSTSSGRPCCDGGCLLHSSSFSAKLEELAKVMNDRPKDKPVTVEEIKTIIKI